MTTVVIAGQARVESKSRLPQRKRYRPSLRWLKKVAEGWDRAVVKEGRGRTQREQRRHAYPPSAYARASNRGRAEQRRQPKNVERKAIGTPLRLRHVKGQQRLGADATGTRIRTFVVLRFAILIGVERQQHAVGPRRWREGAMNVVARSATGDLLASGRRNAERRE